MKFNIKNCLKILVCKYNDGHNLYCKDDYECPHFLNRAIIEKQIPKKPIIWEHHTIESPIPNDDWGYECPCCGNCDIDYPEHHCECGQALDWSDTKWPIKIDWYSWYIQLHRQ